MHDRVNRKALGHMVRTYDVGGKLLNRIKSMYVTSLAFVRVKGGGGRRASVSELTVV